MPGRHGILRFGTSNIKGEPKDSPNQYHPLQPSPPQPKDFIIIEQSDSSHKGISGVKGG